MAAHDSIPPFVGDRDAFGHWLSGFTDGEGHFCLGYGGTKRFRCPVGTFGITLRDDDIQILRTIQSFFGCGRIHSEPARGTSNPRARFLIWRSRDLVSIVVTQFEHYPLRAKKALDFQIWKEAMKLAEKVRWRRKLSAGLHKGTVARWTQDDRDSFHRLKLRLQEGRAYSSKNCERIEEPENGLDLFAGL